jgi:cyclopropane-fatty-acyl-phospholipid synthase
MFLFGPRHSAMRDAHAVRFHYDLGNEFYALWLDPQMVYSCAYFERPDQDLESAQTAKLDYICRKLRLQRGERFLDIGAGWGALVIHAAKHYGVQATGITLSEKQAKFARQRIEAMGLSESAAIHVHDYRELGAYQFDKIASVGMVEHVGHERLAEYFAAAHRTLAPGGVFLNHGIVSVEDARPHGWRERLWRRVWRDGAFIDKYVFPDGELIPSGRVVSSAEGIGFELRDAENLREHYVMTLRHWRRRLEAHEKEARAMVGDVTYRVWRVYLASSAYAFRIGKIGVVQSLFAKHDARGGVRLPLRRNDLYTRDEPARRPRADVEVRKTVPTSRERTSRSPIERSPRGNGTPRTDAGVER